MAVDQSRVASMLPENMIAGGLLDDVDGLIKKVRLVPWDYNGTIANHVLAVRVDIQPLDAQGNPEGEVYQQHYSAGDLDQYVPSMDGVNPAPGLVNFGEEGSDPEAAEGIYALRVGKKEGLSSTSNWAHFLGSALDAKFPRERFSADVSFFEGTIAHFNRVPQKKRSGLIKAAAPVEGGKKNNDILVITEFKGFATGGAKGKPVPAAPPSTPSSAKPSSPAAPAATGVGDLDSILVGLVKEAVAAPTAVEGLSKTKLPSVVLSKAPAALKGKGVKRVVEADFLTGHDDLWAYDPESGTLFNV